MKDIKDAKDFKDKVIVRPWSLRSLVSLVSFYGLFSTRTRGIPE